MARKNKNGVNVSEAIRSYLKANAGVGPTAAAAAISKQVGRTVSPMYVSNIKSTMNGPAKKSSKRRRLSRKNGALARAARAHANGTVELRTIVAVKELLDSVGVDKVRQLIDLLA